MKYHFNEQINKMLKELEEQILKEYDNAPPIHVRVDLLPLNHNATSEYEKKVNEDGSVETVVNEGNREHDKTLVAIHEATPGKPDGSMPTKPDKDIGLLYYRRILRNGDKEKVIPYGSTIGYHAMVTSKGLLDEPEIVIYMPATFSPNQVGNSAYQKYAYGIERLCGEDQNYHLAIANQAILTAFVLKQMGYDKQAAMRHVFPHNFFAKNHKECPARMLYASRLLEKTKDGTELTPEEKEILQEYVPWQVFHSLVEKFLEREKFPPELEQKFIYDKEDYIAYKENPEAYNYAERKRKKAENLHSVNLTNEEETVIPKSNSKRIIEQYKYGSQIEERKLPKVSVPEDLEI